MSKTNSLTSHMGESSNIPARKMGGWYKNNMRGASKKFWKKFYTKKRRHFLKQIFMDKV
jgi:hypothetical protein